MSTKPKQRRKLRREREGREMGGGGRKQLYEERAPQLN